MPRSSRLEAALNCQIRRPKDHKAKTWYMAMSLDYRGSDDTVPTLLFRGCSWRVLENVCRWIGEHGMPTLCKGLRMYREEDCERINGKSSDYLCVEVSLSEQSIDSVIVVFTQLIGSECKARIKELKINEFVNL